MHIEAQLAARFHGGGWLIGDDEDRCAGRGDRVEGGLGYAFVIEDAVGDHRRGVGEREEAEAAGRPVLEAPEGLDLVLE